MRSGKPEFRRQESWRYKRVAENWRRPRGVTSKMRKEESGFPAKVKAGYGSDSSTRGLHPRGLVDRLVWRESELEKLDPKIHIVRIARRVGERKRLGIVEKAKQRNFHIANPGKEEARPVIEQPVAGATEPPREEILTGETEGTGTEQVVESSDNEDESSTVEESSE